MFRIVLSISYDGSSYHGWQQQQNVPSVQGQLEKALQIIANHPVITTAAGRTDKGVHATSQIVHFDTSTSRKENAWVQGVNTYLAKDIRVLWATYTTSDFDARKSALARHYRYFIYNHKICLPFCYKNITWHYKKLNEQLMHQAAQYWIGEHDFSSFRSSECQSTTAIRNVQSITVTRQGNIIIVDVIANAFLHHMIRNMIGVLLPIGEEKFPPVWAQQVLYAKNRNHRGITAPPNGLYLTKVTYPKNFLLPQAQTINNFGFFTIDY